MDEKTTLEYKGYKALADGNTIEDVQKAIGYYRENRGNIETWLLSVGFKEEPLHIRAYEDSLKEREKIKELKPSPNY